MLKQIPVVIDGAVDHVVGYIVLDDKITDEMILNMGLAWSYNDSKVVRHLSLEHIPAALKHTFDPGNKKNWAMPRCIHCREFREHAYHQEV
jgi:hypothetical protein